MTGATRAPPSAGIVRQCVVWRIAPPKMRKMPTGLPQSPIIAKPHSAWPAATSSLEAMVASSRFLTRKPYDKRLPGRSIATLVA